jgi:hypothetical protein
MHYRDLTGDYETTIYEVARQLLGRDADPADMVATCRNGVLSMSGVIGELAKWTAVFSAKGPGLARVKPPISAPSAGKSPPAGMEIPCNA